MQIKRIEPNGKLVIRFCCDEIASEICGRWVTRIYLNKDFKFEWPNDRRVVRQCPFCGTKIDYGEEDEKG